MTVENKDGLVVLTPSENKRLTNGIIIGEYNKPIYLGVNDTPEAWTEIDEIKETIFNVTNEVETNPGGSKFNVEQLEDCVKISFDTSDYCGGLFASNIPNCSTIDVTYKSSLDIPFKLQIRDGSKTDSKTHIIKACDDWVTERFEFDKTDIEFLELYIQTEKSEHLSGELYIKELVAINN